MNAEPAETPRQRALSKLKSAFYAAIVVVIIVLTAIGQFAPVVFT